MNNCCLEIAIEKLLNTGFSGTDLDVVCELHKNKRQWLQLIGRSDVERALGRMLRKNNPRVKIMSNKYPYYNKNTPAPIFAKA